METSVTDERFLQRLGAIPDRRQREDRRGEIRMASRSSAARLSVAARPPVEVHIRDVSRSGLGISTPSPMLVGSSIIVVCGGLTINGTVRHCRERVAGEYFAGIAITKIVSTGDGKEI